MMTGWLGSPGNGFFGGGWWLMGIGMILNLLFWGGLIYLVLRYFEGRGYGGSSAGHSNHGSHLNSQPESAEEILRQRYARGEITQEQYRQMLETLRK